MMLQNGGLVQDKSTLNVLIDRIFQKLDRDQSNSLDYEEFQLGSKKKLTT